MIKQLENLLTIKAMKKIICLDNNNGETMDRYTFINTKTGDMLGSSETGAGFFQYGGNIADNYMHVSYGYSWRRTCDVKKCTKYAIELFLSDCSHVGKLIELSTIDKNLVKQAKEYLA